MDSTPRHTLRPLYTWRTAVAQSDLTASEKHVALTLALFMNEVGGSAFPGAELLATYTSLSVRTVRSTLKSLVGKGWLTIVEHGGIKGGRRRANAYEATTPATVAGVPDEDPCNVEPPPLQPATPTPATSSPHLSSTYPRTGAAESTTYAHHERQREEREKEEARIAAELAEHKPTIAEIRADRERKKAETNG